MIIVCKTRCYIFISLKTTYFLQRGPIVDTSISERHDSLRDPLGDDFRYGVCRRFRSRRLHQLWRQSVSFALRLRHVGAGCFGDVQGDSWKPLDLKQYASPWRNTSLKHGRFLIMSDFTRFRLILLDFG